MAVTMRDVAARAGVSPVVVSRVLHNKALAVRVSEATAERVRQAAKDLDYRCNIWARNFRAQETRTIGVLHGIGFARPLFDSGSRYFAALMDGIVGGAFDHDYSISLCPKLMGTTPEGAMGDGRFDGLIWYSTLRSEENREMLMSCSVPLVLIHLRKEDYDHKFSTVVCDSEHGIRLALDHLVELGHRRIGFAAEAAHLNTEVGRRADAFRRQMIQRGLWQAESDVIYMDYGYQEVDEYLANRHDHTAIIASSEGLAATFLARAERTDRRVPDDLSIVGFDSTAFCLEFRPTLTSISQPLAAMGARAVQMLVDQMKGERQDPQEVVLPCGFDVRESTAPPRSN